MLLPQKFRFTIVAAIALLSVATSSVTAQISQFEARSQAIRAARARAQQDVQQVQYSEAVGMTDQVQYADNVAPPRPVERRVARAPQQRVARANRVSPNGYQPQHLRTAQIYNDGPVIHSGSPIVSSGCATGNCSSDVALGAPVDEFIGGGDCGCGGGGCDGGCGAYDAACGFEVPCSERGGCPPGSLENCWINGLGAILRNGEYFGGATAFKGPGFGIPGGTNSVDDCNFGLYGGANLGIPLCKLSCGIFSGQIGFRSVQTRFNGSSFTPENRDQLFVTAGIFRRVDYGLQAGVAVDFLHEEWFADTDLAQMRFDIAWAYPGGSSIGFRGAKGTDDDLSDGTFDGTAFTGLATTVVDNYRFYYRSTTPRGGFAEIFAGWADDTNTRTILGFNSDTPVNSLLATQTSVTYVIADDVANVGGTDADAWNIAVGFSFRPRGRAWYQHYDRPMFDVADNGTFLFNRQ